MGVRKINLKNNEYREIQKTAWRDIDIRVI